MSTFTKEKLHLPRMQPLPPGAQGAALLWQGAAMAAGALLGAGQVYGGAAPFGLALVLGCPQGSLYAAAVGAVIAALAWQPAVLGLPLAAALLAAAAGRRLGGAYRYGAVPAVLVLGAGQTGAALWYGAGWNAAQGVQLAVTAALALVCGAGIARLPIHKTQGAALWLAMAAACLQRFALPGLAPGLVLAASVGLCAASAGTLEQSTVLCIALAAGVAAASPELCSAALAVALGTLCAACFGTGERWRCIGAFLLGGMAGALALPTPAAALPLAVGAVVAVLCCLGCPNGVLRALFPPPAPPAQAQGMTGAARRLTHIADTLSDIADTVNAVCAARTPPKGESYDFVVEHVARTTCRSCAQRSRCWVKGYATAMDGLYRLKPTLENQGQVQVEQLPGQLSVCIHPADLCTAVNHGYRLWRSRRQARARTTALRTALTEQYGAVAAALAQLAERLGQAGLSDPRREQKVAQLFAQLGLEALECSVTADLGGRITVGVTVARTRFTQEELAALTVETGRICGRDLSLPDVVHCRTVTMLSFAEKPLFEVEFGASGRPARGQTISGDALQQFCDAAGRAQMLLCDGMGTGRAAAVDGQLAAKLTAQLLRAGFAAQSAARLVNVAMCLKNTEQESGATLDLLTVDLYNGRAGLFKAGAAPSFLIHEGTPRRLEGASLPIGVSDSVVGRSTSFALEDGDWAVLISDGVLCDGEEWLMQQLQLCVKLGHSPQQAAQTVAEAAARRAGDKQDDITVAVLRMRARPGRV